MSTRRTFIVGLGAAAAWPFTARAQQTNGPTIGILEPGAPGSLPEFEAPLRKGLSEMGYVEGRNLTLEYRYAQNQLERVPNLAADLIHRRVAVIATLGSDAVAAAAKTATTTIPIVFEMGGDPVESGFVASFNRPGGNLTGLTSMNAELGAKRLGLLHDLLPQVHRIGAIINPISPATPLISKVLQAAASRIGVQIELSNARTSAEIATAFVSLLQARVEAIVGIPGPPFTDHYPQMATLASRYALPAIYSGSDASKVGGLMSYSPTTDRIRQVGIYIGRILKGEKPADLPVMQAAKFEFIINLQTARTLSIEVPPALLSIADEVIE